VPDRVSHEVLDDLRHEHDVNGDRGRPEVPLLGLLTDAGGCCRIIVDL